MKDIVDKLIKQNKTIATMESCTGGHLANSITNIEGSSQILKVSLITYSDEYKIKFGVKKETIAKYGVYSIETAKEMSKCVSEFANSDYGIGITGRMTKLNTSDAIVYISIYNRNIDNYITMSIDLPNQARFLNKQLVVNRIEQIMRNMS